MFLSHILALVEVKQPENPLPDVSTIQDLIIKFIEYGLSIAGLIAIVFIILGGFQYISSAGNEEQAKKGTKSLTSAIIGLIIVFSAYAIVWTIKNRIL